MTNLGFALSAVQIRFEVAILFTNNSEFLLPSFRIRGQLFLRYIIECMELAAVYLTLLPVSGVYLSLILLTP